MTRTELEAMADAYAKTEEKKKENDDYYFNRSLELQDGFVAGFLAGRDAAIKIIEDSPDRYYLNLVKNIKAIAKVGEK